MFSKFICNKEKTHNSGPRSLAKNLEQKRNSRFESQKFYIAIDYLIKKSPAKIFEIIKLKKKIYIYYATSKKDLLFCHLQS